MAVLIETQDACLAFGLVWRAVEQKTERREAAAFLRRHNAAHRLRWNQHGHLRYGVIRSLKAGAPLDTGSKLPLLSAAALFAARVGAHTNALFFFPADPRHDKHALIAVVDGMPWLDVLVPSNLLRERIESLKEEGHGDFAEYGQHPDFPHAVEWSLAELLTAPRGLALMTKIAQRNPLVLKGVVLLGAVMVSGGLSAWDYYDREQKKQEEAAGVPSVDAGAEYRKSVDKLMVTAGFSGSAALQAFWTPLADRSPEMAGWSAMRITCTRQSCVEEWARRGGTNAQLIEQLPAGMRYEFKLGKDGGDMMLLSRTPSLAITPMKPQSLPAREAFWLKETSRMQSLQFSSDLIGGYGVRFTLAPAQLAAVPSTINARLVPKHSAVAQGGFTIAGPLGLMQQSLLALNDNMSIDELGVDISEGAEGARFTVKGKYYVKN
jgi:hypothetical protein